jgi:hypothetical protein
MDKLLAALVQKLTTAYGDGLVSVVLYGSGASGDHQPGYSDVNVLCVLREVATRELAAAEEIFRWWREEGSPAPILISEQELACSTDCFAIEIHDIRRNRRLLHGRDVIAELPEDNSFYRAQVEHDLRAKFLRLRQKAAGLMFDPALLRRLLLDSLSTFCVLFRHALILHGVEAPLAKRAVIAAAGEHLHVDTFAFEKLLDLREQRIKPRDVDARALLEACLKSIAGVIDAVDRLAK